MTSAAELNYQWIADWAKVPTAENFAHHGLTMLSDGNILSGHADKAVCRVFSPEGEVIREFEVPVQSTHGLHVHNENSADTIWINDVQDDNMVKVDLNGNELARITRDKFPLPEGSPFKPTASAVDPTTGDIWVTDGYGSSTVHCFSSNLEHKFMIDGSEEVGPLKQPHWIFIDMRSGTPLVYVADRMNDRVQVFNTDGSFHHAITEGLITPSIFSTFGDYLVIGELKARLVICDKDDNIIQYLGAGHGHLEKAGWPNRILTEGEDPVSPLNDIPEGEFNSPHGVCADKDGNIYISEWLIGDRFTKLARCA